MCCWPLWALCFLSESGLAGWPGAAGGHRGPALVKGSRSRPACLSSCVGSSRESFGCESLKPNALEARREGGI